MKKIGSSRASPRRVGYFLLASCPVVAGAVAIFILSQSAVAAEATVGLGTAGSYAVLAGQAVTNTGPSVISGDIGVSPGTAVTGFPPGIQTNGATHAADAQAAQAQADLTTAYNDAAGRTSPPANIVSVIGAGQTLVPGVYNATSSLEVGGSLTLNAQGNSNAVFIFQAGSTLITDTGTTILLTNGASVCNVFWQVGSSATLNTSTTFVGTILALTSISVLTGDTIDGRVLARNGSVTLDTDTITGPRCSGTTPTPSPSVTPTGTRPAPSPTGTGPSPSPTGTGPSPSPTGTRPSPSPTGTSPSPSPTGTRPSPSPTGTRPSPSPTGTSPSPSPTGTSPTSRPKPKPKPRPKPAPVPKPVGTTFPVTG